MNEIINAQLLQLQNHGAEVRSQYFRVRVVLHFLLKSLFCV